MRSRISFFDRNLSKSLLKRFWPLWLGYLLVLLWALPVYIFNYSSTSWANFDLSSRVLQAARDSVLYLSVASVLTAMAVFSHLYNRKDCGLINSLPLRRETVFCTACVTGLLALLLCALLAWLAAMAAFGTSPRVGPGPLGDWLLSMTLNTLSFYGIAVFCAMLTGNVLAVPALFVVINTAAYFLEAMGQSLMSVLIYGFYPGDPLLVWLSPTICIFEKLRVDNYAGEASLEGLGVLTAYAVLGLFLMAASLLVYRRRHMETAGDIVAVKWLKPVFKYGFTLGVALMFNYITINMALQNSIGGPRAAVLVTVLLCAGAVIGFYGAEMLMQRSTHVFRSRPLGLVISCALLAGMVLGCELDPAGYEQRIPQREDIQYVRIFNSWRGLATDDPEAIDLYLSLHEAILQNKAHNESSSVFRYMRLEYQLSDGSIFRRDYSVDSSREWIDSGSSELVLAQQFLALPSVKKCASAAVPSIKESSISSCWLMEKTPILASPEATDIVGYSENRISLSAEQAAELYNQCILPDLEDSRLGVNWLYQGPEYREYESNMVFCFTTASVNSPSPKVFNSEPEPVPNERSFNITMDAERTINWLGDNVGVTPVPMPDPADELYY